MNLKFFIFLGALSAAPLALTAQEPAALKAMRVAFKFRADLAGAVSKNAESPTGALKRLRASGTASGLSVDRDADFAYAALDVGRRLLASDRPAAAEEFFHAAEQAFEQVVNQTPRAQAREKSQYLQKLALVRGKYLNKVAQAKADIDAAAQLQPDDKSLGQLRSQLAREHGEAFKSVGKN